MGRDFSAWALWSVIGGASMGASLMGFAACSNGDSTTDSGPGNDASKDTTGMMDTGNDQNMQNDGDASMIDCGTLKLYPSPEGGPYCPFQAPADGGDGAAVFGNCAHGSHCCEGTSAEAGVSYCAMANQMCPGMGYIDWQCDEPGHCTAAMTTCCLEATKIQPDMYCSGQATVGTVKSTVCQAMCAGTMTEAQMCAAQSDCPMNKTCTNFKKNGKQLGVCL